jgi:hypothetical protein
VFGSVDETFENQIHFRIDREGLAHYFIPYSLCCLSYSTIRFHLASFNRRLSARSLTVADPTDL